MSFKVVNQSLWTDEKVMDEYSCEDKYFWLYLLTNPQANQLGIYKLPVKLAAFQLGYSREQVLVLLDRFERSLKQIRFNRETQEVAIGNYLAYSVVKGGKPVFDCIMRDMAAVKDETLFDFVLAKLSAKVITNQTVKQVIDVMQEKRNKKDIENENDNANDNDNDNDNDESYHDSSHESSKPAFHCFGDDLTDEQISAGRKDHEIIEDYIQRFGLGANDFNRAEIGKRLREWGEAELKRAFETAALSNSRQTLSFSFVDTVHKSAGAESSVHSWNGKNVQKVETNNPFARLAQKEGIQ